MELLPTSDIIGWIKDMSLEDTKQNDSDIIENFQDTTVENSENLEILTKNELIIKLQILLNEYIDKEEDKNNYNRYNYYSFLFY